MIGEPAVVFYLRARGVDAHHVDLLADALRAHEPGQAVYVVAGYYARRTGELASWRQKHGGETLMAATSGVVGDVRLLDDLRQGEGWSRAKGEARLRARAGARGGAGMTRAGMTRAGMTRVTVTRIVAVLLFAAGCALLAWTLAPDWFGRDGSKDLGTRETLQLLLGGSALVAAWTVGHGPSRRAAVARFRGLVGSAEPVTAGRILVTAAWLGLVAGLGEVAWNEVVRLQGAVVRGGPHRYWMCPLSNLVYFCGVWVVVCAL